MWPFRRSAAAIRSLHLADAVNAAAIHAQSFARPWGQAEMEALIADRACLGHAVASRSLFTLIDGFVLSRIAGDEAEILTIAVRQSRQGQGLARQLLLHHLGALGPFGVKALFLEVDESNAAALALYRRTGFRKVGERKSYYRRPDGTAANAIVMRRNFG